MSTFLREAFQQMDLLESNDFTFDNTGATKLANFMEGDMLNDFEAIIDPEAETQEELKDSYIGNVVCECQVCKSKIYKEPEEITVDEEAALANVGECCPYCFERDGFKIIGQIAPYEEVTVETDADVEVEVNGDEVPVTDEDRTARHAKDNEDLEDSQRFPVEGTKQVDLTEKRAIKSKRRHARDNEDLEDSQRYPIESPVGTKGLKESADDLKGIHEAEGTVAHALMSVKDKIDECGSDIAACKQVVRDVLSSDAVSEKNKSAAESIIGMLDGLKTPAHFWSSFARWIGAPKSISNNKRLARHKKDNEDLEDSQRYPIESPAPAQTGLAMMEGLSNREKLLKAFPELNFDAPVKESVDSQLTEAMEDISITTNDEVIKVKATPRTDKEAIQPVTPETAEIIETPAESEEIIEDEVVAETPDEALDDTTDVEIEEFDEETFDELGESYLKEVYDNVKSYKTQAGQVDGNKLYLEGVITFNSGKAAKTKFVFESFSKTRQGKLKFKGMNEHISSRKNTYTLTGKMSGSKLVLESLNYNYGAKSNEGTSKRLYGTVRVKSK